MAGGVLIGIMVATFMVLMLRKGGAISAEYDTQMSDNELAKFNSQFEIYDRTDNTFFDVITAANLAYDINKKNGYDEQNSVTVTVIINEGSRKGTYLITPNLGLKKNYFMEGETDQVYMYDFIEEYTKKQDGEYAYLFKCIGENGKSGIEYNTTTGKVKGIRFEIVEND